MAGERVAGDKGVSLKEGTAICRQAAWKARIRITPE